MGALLQNFSSCAAQPLSVSSTLPQNEQRNAVTLFIFSFFKFVNECIRKHDRPFANIWHTWVWVYTLNNRRGKLSDHCCRCYLVSALLPINLLWLICCNNAVALFSCLFCHTFLAPSYVGLGESGQGQSLSAYFTRFCFHIITFQ